MAKRKRIARDGELVYRSREITLTPRTERQIHNDAIAAAVVNLPFADKPTRDRVRKLYR